MLSPFNFADEELVVGAQTRTLKEIRAQDGVIAAALDASIARAEAAVAKLDADLPPKPSAAFGPEGSPTALVSFAELATAAPSGAGLHDALAENEIEATLARLYGAGRRPEAETTLDRWDWSIAGTAGLLGAAANMTLVGLPTTSIADLEPLPRLVRSALDRALPRRKIRKLEADFKVPFDASMNKYLKHRVDGLFPRSHRFHSLGHDPMLGWIIGVKDVLNGTFTAVAKDGKIIVQQTKAPAECGQGLFIGLLEAFYQVGGHMLSDVSTKAGLPAPLMPLLQFAQVGHFGKRDRTIADLGRFMYLKGYDFRHFTAGSLTSVIVEAIIRGAWMARRLDEGCSLSDAVSGTDVPRLRRQLLLGHATAAAVNAGKIALTRNPLALNWAQWLAVLRYLGPEVLHQIREPSTRAAASEAMLDAELCELTHA